MSSEHTIDGELFDMEMHIVNMNEDEKTKDLFLAAVIGVLFEISEDNYSWSWADDFFQKLIRG